MGILLTIRRTLQLVRSPERNIVAAIVDDPLKVQREIRFLFLRLAIFLGIAIVIIVSSIVSIRSGAVRIEERRALQRQLYSKFESMARLSHDIDSGRAALEKIRSFFPKDDNLLPFLKALEALGKETGNKASFRFDQGVPTPASDIPPYRFVTYTITLEGDMRTFLRYLEVFHALPYLVTLDAVTITGDRDIAETKSFAQIKGKLYVQ